MSATDRLARYMLRTLPPIDVRCILLGLIIVLEDHEHHPIVQSDLRGQYSSAPRVAFAQQLRTPSEYVRKRDLRRAIERERDELTARFWSRGVWNGRPVYGRPTIAPWETELRYLRGWL